MLYLTRKEGERLLIGKNIVVEVTNIQGNHVRIGVEAPKDIKIDRPEFIEKDNAGNK